LSFQTPHVKEATSAAFFIDMVSREAAELLQRNEEQVWTGGYTIETTLDQATQVKLENETATHIQPKDEIQMAAIVLEPETGAIRGLTGGTAYEKSTFNRATDAKRMVGSTFKPFVYYAALERGFTPTTKLLSEPTRFVTKDGAIYEPSNYNGYYAYESISLAQAIALSDNIYAVKTNLFLRPETVIETARKFGITSDLPAVPSLALGSASISLLEMTSAYGMIANGGKQLSSYTIEKITSHSGRVLFERKETPKQVLDVNKAFVLT